MTSSRAVAIWENLQRLSKRGTLSKLVQALPIQTLGKLLILVVFLANMRSWPLVWHLRLFRPVLSIRFQLQMLRVRTFFKSAAAKAEIEDRWIDSISPIGVHPFKVMVPYKTRVTPDDSDWNGHLSNSSYPKILDMARLKAAVELFPRFFPVGGALPLAGTHFYFIREIPAMSQYEVRCHIGSWDQKWMYVLSKFVLKPSGKRKHTEVKPPPVGEVSTSQLMVLSDGGSEAISAGDTPASQTPLSNGVAGDTAASLNKVAAQLSGEEPDGAVVHTVGISQICFKIGRITIPPGLVMAINGVTGLSGHSHENPHLQWTEAQKIFSRPNGGSGKKLRAFLTGGWKEVPESQRWWDQALGPEVEEQRRRNLALIEGLRRGMENARNL